MAESTDIVKYSKEAPRNTKWINLISKLTWHSLLFSFNIILDNFIISLWMFIIAVVLIIISIYERVYIKEIMTITEKLPTIMLWTSHEGIALGLDCNGARCNILSRQKVPLGQIQAFVFSGSQIDFNDLPPRRPRDVIWALNHEESPKNVAELNHEKVLNLFNFSATFSRHSDVPYPNQFVSTLEDITSTKYFVKTSIKNALLDELAPIIYLQSNCPTSTDRDMYVAELMKFIKIDSYGSCLRNKVANDSVFLRTKTYLDKLGNDNFHKFLAKYKFSIAIENAVCNDYSTEKLWRAIKIGTVPIYFGDPLIREWLPNKKSAILLEDFPTPKLMSEHINKLNKNDQLYEEYLEHKIHKRISNRKLIDTKENIDMFYQDNYSDISTKLLCLVCRKIYAKRRGKSDVNIVNKYHYNCPKPISALNFKVNAYNDYTFRWGVGEQNAILINKVVMENYTLSVQRNIHRPMTCRIL